MKFVARLYQTIHFGISESKMIDVNMASFEEIEALARVHPRQDAISDEYKGRLAHQAKMSGARPIVLPA